MADGRLIRQCAACISEMETFQQHILHNSFSICGRIVMIAKFALVNCKIQRNDYCGEAGQGRELWERREDSGENDNERNLKD